MRCTQAGDDSILGSGAAANTDDIRTAGCGDLGRERAIAALFADARMLEASGEGPCADQRRSAQGQLHRSQPAAPAPLVLE
jgi:hypothetical protein